VLVWVLVGVVGYQGAAMAADWHRKRAIEAAAVKDWRGLAVESLQAWKYAPLDGRTLKLAGAALIMLDRHDLAIPALEQSLILRRGQVHALSDLAVAYAKAGRYSDAKLMMHKARRLLPDAPELERNERRIEKLSTDRS